MISKLHFGCASFCIVDRASLRACFFSFESRLHANYFAENSLLTMAQVSNQPEKEEISRRTEATDDEHFPPPPSHVDAQDSPLATHLHSVLDAQLEALALGHNDLASLLLSSKSVEGLDPAFFKHKGPNSLLGTGSSVASASDHEVSSSDFESDSGIENSHTEVHSPEMSVGAAKQQEGAKKGVGPYLDVMPHDDLAVTAASDTYQSDVGEKSCDKRIESFIQCLDEKVCIL